MRDDIKPQDERQRKDGWCAGDYLCTCRSCGCRYVGDKRSWECADCAYNRSLKVGEIILKYLEDNGYDGLYCSYIPCGCKKEDLAPCEGPITNCQAGYLMKCDCGEECPWHIGPTKEK